MVELTPWPPERREAVRNNLREFIGHAIKACPDQAEALNEAKRAGFELTSIMSGNPNAGSFRLRQLVDQLDRAKAHFEVAASELEADSPLQSFHLGQAARVVSDAAFWVHCPEPAPPCVPSPAGGQADGAQGDGVAEGDADESKPHDPPKRRGRRRKDPTELTKAKALRVLLFEEYTRRQKTGQVDRGRLAADFDLKWGDANKLIAAERKYRTDLESSHKPTDAKRLIKQRIAAAKSVTKLPK
jgi:hypothetical protein